MNENKVYRAAAVAKEIRRNVVITLRVTKDERERLRTSARERNLTLSVLGRYLLLGQIPSAVTDRQFAQELGRIGNNLNQVARAFNSGVFPGVENVRREIQELRALLLKVQQELRDDRQTFQRS